MEENEQQRPVAVEPGEAGDAEDELEALVGRQVTKSSGLSGHIKNFDPATELYQVVFADDSSEDLTLSELKLLLPQEIERISAADDVAELEEDTSPTKTSNEPPEKAAEASATVQDVLTTGEGEIKEQVVQEDTAPVHTSEMGDPVSVGTEIAPTELPEEQNTDSKQQETADTAPQDAEEQVEDPENATGDADMKEDDQNTGEEEAVKEDGGDTDSSLDRELLSQKKRKKRRAHVLTLQKYKGKKRKRKVEEAKAIDEGEDEPPSNVEVEEAMPRLESRVKKLSEVQANAKEIKRQKLKENAQALKSILKQSIAPLDDAEQGSPRTVTKSKDISLLLEKTPAVDKPKDVASILQSKPSPYDRGIKLRGRKLKKKINGKFHRGEVADYDRRTRYYKIFYEDGDEEKLMWKDVEPLLVTFDEMGRWDNPEDADAQTKDKNKPASRKRQKK